MCVAAEGSRSSTSDCGSDTQRASKKHKRESGNKTLQENVVADAAWVPLPVDYVFTTIRCLILQCESENKSAQESVVVGATWVPLRVGDVFSTICCLVHRENLAAEQCKKGRYLDPLQSPCLLMIHAKISVVCMYVSVDHF